MVVDNQTPFAVAPLFWEDLSGRAKLTVIVKATFLIPGHGAVRAPDQLPLLARDKTHDEENPAATVRFESDQIPFKPRADVVLVGRAHAPLGRAVTELDVSLRVGALIRTIRVFGDRKWRFFPVPAVTAPKPFVTMDLTYERAFGGIDGPGAKYCPENLVGKGFIGKQALECIQDKPLPNLEDPRHLIRTTNSCPWPVGFGFYGRGWQPRLTLAGTYDERYRKERAPALPLDFSYAVFNGAHPDLQVEGYLRGDEEVELENLSPQGRVRFRLTGVRPQITVTRWTIAPDEWLAKNSDSPKGRSEKPPPLAEEAVPAVLDTLVLVPEENLYYQVFRGVCPLARLDATEVARIRVTL
jgi:hypothetical protein